MNTILAVDDAQDTLMLLEFDLQSEGYEVITANDGETAINILSKQKVDLILLDLYMPGLSGLETLEKIKAQSEFVNTPIIMLSASDDENEIVSALELGANDYITKPYIPKVLLARLKTSLRLLEKTLTLESLAQTDFLTGVNNKGNFEDLMKKSIKQMSRTSDNVSVAMLDIDFFKKINDNYGHDIGDDVLKLFADTMQKTFREYDILGRVGGEEFAVCMPNTDIEEGFYACERFRDAVSKLSVTTSDGISVNFTVSIGVASVSHNDGNYDPASLMRAADQFLYQAKETSRNCTKTYEDLSANSLPPSSEDSKTEVSMEKTEESNSRYPGIDYNIGVNNVLGDESLFKEILQMFYDDHHLDGDKIQKAITDKDQASLKHLVHTLKGVACSVGAMQLFENTKELDVAVNEGNESKYQSLFDDVSYELKRVLSGII